MWGLTGLESEKFVRIGTQPLNGAHRRFAIGKAARSDQFVEPLNVLRAKCENSFLPISLHPAFNRNTRKAALESAFECRGWEYGIRELSPFCGLLVRLLACAVDHCVKQAPGFLLLLCCLPRRLRLAKTLLPMIRPIHAAILEDQKNDFGKAGYEMKICGALGRIRTYNQRIMSPLL